MALRTRMHATALALGAASLFAPSAAGAADTLHATRGSIVEKTHAVDVVLRRGHARMRVVREVANRGERHDQALFHIFLPDRAVATGLRTRGSQNGLPVWFEGELLDAEVAAARYRELTGIGGMYPKDPALLSWRSPGHLALQVFPCPPKEDKAVGYDVEVPTTWVEGRDRLEIPALGLDSGRAMATLGTDVPGARILVEGHEVPAGTTIRLDGDRVIELEPPLRPGSIEGRLAAVTFGPSRSLVALRFDAPRQMAEVPRNAHVVVAIDASRSVGEDDLAASMRAAGAHLAHYQGRDAKVAVLAYDRRARDLTHGFVSLERARAVLDGAPPTRGNGSAVEAAVARATALLAGAPSGAPKRVVVLHDELSRASLDPARVAAPSGAVVHVAHVTDSGEGGSTEREDDVGWAALPRASGGLFFEGSAPSGALAKRQDRADVERAFLEWARPVRLDFARWHAAGAEDEGGGQALEEGGVIEYRAIQSKTPAVAVLEGELWSRPSKTTLAADAGEARLWSALVFGDELLSELTEDEMKILARAGRAVSPVTSYLAIEPGVRPSTEGLDENEAGGGRGEGIGLGGIGTLGRGAGGGGSSPPDYAAALVALVREGVARCGATGRAHLDVETTFTEVVDVTASVTGDAPTRPLARCVEEVVWAVELPAIFGESRMGVHTGL